MRKIVWLGLLLALLCRGAAAQNDFPRVQVFGAVSLLNENSANPANHLSGWLAGAEYDRWNHLGAEAELSGGYGTAHLDATRVSSSAYSLNIGPRFFLRLPHLRNKQSDSGVTLFAHVLAGATHFSSNGGFAPESRTGGSLIPGVGFELRLRDSWAARFGVDAHLSGVFGSRTDSPRVAIGFVHSFATHRSHQQSD